MENLNASPADLQKALKGIDYPASNQDLLEYVNSRKSENKVQVMDLLKKLPEKVYNSPVDVSKAVADLD